MSCVHTDPRTGIVTAWSADALALARGERKALAAGAALVARGPGHLVLSINRQDDIDQQTRSALTHLLAWIVTCPMAPRAHAVIARLP